MWPATPTQLLHSRGVDLVRAEFVPDCKRDIVDTVLRLRERVGPDGFVFTSGGIGETNLFCQALAMSEAGHGLPLRHWSHCCCQQRGSRSSSPASPSCPALAFAQPTRLSISPYFLPLAPLTTPPGPTHDDITYASVAAAFGADLHMHQPTVDLMVQHYSKRDVELNEARLRMAMLPMDGQSSHLPPLARCCLCRSCAWLWSAVDGCHTHQTWQNGLRCDHTFDGRHTMGGGCRLVPALSTLTASHLGFPANAGASGTALAPTLGPCLQTEWRCCSRPTCGFLLW